MRTDTIDIRSSILRRSINSTRWICTCAIIDVVERNVSPDIAARLERMTACVAFDLERRLVKSARRLRDRIDRT